MKKLLPLLQVVILVGIIFSGCTRNVDPTDAAVTTQEPETTARVAAIAATNLIDNESVWHDTNGNEIFAQGGGIIKVESTWHWFGPQFNPSSFSAINHYTSTDLIHWSKQAPALAPGMSGIPFSSTSWVGRPWVMWNPNTNLYVMVVEWGAGGGYRNRYVFLTSPSINGPWTYRSDKVIKQLPDVNNVLYNLGDVGVYSEGGNAWLLYTFDKPEANYSQAILKLDADFMTPLPPVAGNYTEFTGGTWRAGVQEAAGVFKRNNTYYYFTSTCAGWNSSETRYRTATSMAGPWSNNAIVPTNAHHDSSYNTQHDFVLPVVGTTTTTYMYCGDRWSNFTGKGVGRNAWFPLSFDAAGVPAINGPDYLTNGGDWLLDATTGEWSVPVANLIKNPGFENDFANWTYTGNASIATATAEVNPGGAKAVKSWSSSAYTTTLTNASATNCVAGTYTAQVYSRAGGTFTQRVLEVYINGTRVAERTFPVTTTWTAYPLNNIPVPAGATVSISIRLTANANAWTQFDDFSLIRN